MDKKERKQFVEDVREQVAIAKEAIKIMQLAKDKDGAVAYMAEYRHDDLDMITRCAEINKEAEDL